MTYFFCYPLLFFFSHGGQENLSWGRNKKEGVGSWVMTVTSTVVVFFFKLPKINMYCFALLLVVLSYWKTDWCGNPPFLIPALWNRGILKSDKLQYNMLVRWADGTNNSSNKHLTFQVFSFFHNFNRWRALKTFYFYFCIFIKK